MALSGMGRMKLTRSITELCGMRKKEKSRLLLRFGYPVTKKTFITGKVEEAAMLGTKEKITCTPRNREC